MRRDKISYCHVYSPELNEESVIVTLALMGRVMARKPKCDDRAILFDR